MNGNEDDSARSSLLSPPACGRDRRRCGRSVGELRAERSGLPTATGSCDHPSTTHSIPFSSANEATFGRCSLESATTSARSSSASARLFSNRECSKGGKKNGLLLQMAHVGSPQSAANLVAGGPRVNRPSISRPFRSVQQQQRRSSSSFPSVGLLSLPHFRFSRSPARRTQF